MIKLKPCPFCGGEAEVERQGTMRQSCIISCTECGCRHEGPDEYELCGYQWNMRTTEQAHAAKTKAEEAELAAAQELDEVKAECDALVNRVDFLNQQNSAQQEQNDALAAHVERMTDALEDVTQAAQHEGLQFTGWKDQIDSAVAAMLEAPTTSLARLKAKWQAEAISEYALQYLAGHDLVHAEMYAAKLRRQAEEPTE